MQPEIMAIELQIFLNLFAFWFIVLQNSRAVNFLARCVRNISQESN